MGTLVTFHAHPDDEAIACGGTKARAAAEGHRVVLVVATKGEHGEVDDGVLQPGETLAERRTRETHDAARILGVARVEFLGYQDSGMTGTPENERPEAFWQADVEEAAGRLAAILREEQADVLTVYDENGVYGHPDHVQVHRVGVRAGELAGTPRVYENTVNRDHYLALASTSDALAAEAEGSSNRVDLSTLGIPGHLVTTTVDVTGYLDQKRRAMAAHASQISETSFFLAMDPETFTISWGTEWFVRRGADPGTQEEWLLDGDSP